MSTKNFKLIAITLIMLLSAASIAPAAKSQQQEFVPGYEAVADADLHLTAASEGASYVIQGSPEGASCRDATEEESHAFAQRDQLLPLHEISPVTGDELRQQDQGLKIILRATPQLESFPEAKNAFLRAAQTWEAMIRNPITVIIDVDFGPLRFGVPYDNPNLLGSTDPQDIGGPTIYPFVRNKLIVHASSPREVQLYNSLPQATVPTDIGSSAAMAAPSALFRALGINNPVADPPNESNLGPPPSIGFNSAWKFDFDPSDGIDADKTDFDAVALHEMGHALGFSSRVGVKERFPQSVTAPGMLDLLRFRPGVTLATFPTAERILSSGGTQVFFAGGPEVALSTGRDDGTGGDHRQASHWKDDDLNGGQYLGIMDPTFPDGRRGTITDNDLYAFDSMGYQVQAPAAGNDIVPLTSGVTQQGSIRAPKNGQEDAVIDDHQYTIQVPSGASQLTVELNGNQDVDLYVRAAQRITVSSSGLVADYHSDSPTGRETVTVTPSSSPALRAGTYYIAVLNFGPGPASFSIRATVGGGTGGGNSSPVIASLGPT